MAPRWALPVILVLGALAGGSCSRRTVDLRLRACDGGTCVDGYQCDPSTNLCITTGDACAQPGRYLACLQGASSCASGCRVCDDGQWSTCAVPPIPPECSPNATYCADANHVATCGPVGYIESSSACDYGCTEIDRDARCNECAPGLTTCRGIVYVTCSSDGRIVDETSCQGDSQCANIGTCDDGLGCQIQALAPNGTPCDEGAAADGDMCNSACVDGVCIAGATVDCDDHLACTSDRCATSAGCRHDALPQGTICRAVADGDACDAEEACDGTLSDCPPDAVLPGGTLCLDAADPLCDEPDYCDGASKSCPDVAGSADGSVCNGECVAGGEYLGYACQSHHCVAGAPVTCPADACACSLETCASGDTACSTSFATCTSFAFGQASYSTQHEQLLQLDLNAGCAGQSSNIACTTSSNSRLCTYLQRFDGGLDDFSGTGISSADCAVGGVSPDGIPFDGSVASNNCSGKVLRFTPGTAPTLDEARVDTGVSTIGAGLSGVVLHAKAGFNPATEDVDNEHVHVFACCAASGICQSETEVAVLYNYGHYANTAGYGQDNWGERPCQVGTCTRSGYALPPGTFDDCGDVRLRLTYASNNATNNSDPEPAAVDDVALSAIGTHVLPVLPASGGNYAVTLRPCTVGVAQDFQVTCSWSQPGIATALTATTSVHVDP